MGLFTVLDIEHLLPKQVDIGSTLAYPHNVCYTLLYATDNAA